jgi:hypothetical protein
MLAVVVFGIASQLGAQNNSAANSALPISSSAGPAPGDACAKLEAKACLALAFEAMGGRARVEGLRTLRFTAAGHTELTEQSYRQEPFITSYERLNVSVDFAGGRAVRNSHLTWPEADSGSSDMESTLVAGSAGGVVHASGADRPASLSDLDWARDLLSISPARILVSASQASDLHYEAPAVLRSTPHTVLAFAGKQGQIRVLLNALNHLPDAVETTEQFHDHWFQWGDVHRRIYYDNFQLFHGLVYPTNEVEERNGIVWRSTQLLSLALNPVLEEAQFQLDGALAARSLQSPGWNRLFNASKSQALAPGVTLFEGAWNATLVEQEDGVVVLEAPISGSYMQGVLDEARRRAPNLPVKAVLSTSDSWPHVGGVRQAVSQGLPVYILDLNQPLLDRLMRAPHTLQPDALAKSPHAPQWQIVSKKTLLGNGKTRMELYPLRGASTERQYMVYFPDAHLLYASDTLALNDGGTLYDPELMREVIAAVEREGLEVTTVFAMHQGPMPWKQVVDMVANASK